MGCEPNGACRHHNVNGTCKFSQPVRPSTLELQEFPSWMLCHHVSGEFCSDYKRFEANGV